jgi:3-methylfumaryl-CoA hydratase
VRVGDALRRTSTIAKVAEKTGAAGEMVFVTVRHAISRGEALLMEEEQDLVFLAIPERFAPPAPTPLPPCDWSEPAAVDPVRLFRFSAATFNGHRIHYDRTYAIEVERYPALVVHGPFQAVLLFDAASRRAPERTPAAFAFRGVRPLFDSDAVSLNGRARDADALELFTANGEGAVGMQATLQWRPRR